MEAPDLAGRRDLKSLYTMKRLAAPEKGKLGADLASKSSERDTEWSQLDFLGVQRKRIWEQ